MINQQQPRTPEDVLADILKQTENQADIDALIECRAAVALAERIHHRGVEQANDLDLAALTLLKLGAITGAQEVSKIGTQARNTAEVTLLDVLRKMHAGVNKKVARLHPELPSSKGTPIR
jgi:hypothetical protein